METVQHTDTSDTATCNTKNGRSRMWCFTINNWNEESIKMLEIEKEKAIDWAWQSEIGEENGTPHIQGCIKYKNARTFNSMKKTFDGAHIEQCKDWFKSKNYCSKKDTRDGLIIEGKYKIKDPLNGKELYEWQKDIIKIINSEPDDRTIHWYYDKIGCNGKTTLAKHLCMNNKDCIYLTGKAADMKYGIFNMIEQNRTVKTVILDLTRSIENYVSYQGIEEIKNGIFFNTKYESKMCIFDNPHVIIFANFRPIEEKLSIDRWNIVEI